MFCYFDGQVAAKMKRVDGPRIEWIYALELNSIRFIGLLVDSQLILSNKPWMVIGDKAVGPIALWSIVHHSNTIEQIQ